MAKEDQIVAALSTIKSSIRHIRRRTMRMGRYVNDVLDSTANATLPAGYVWIFDPQGDRRISSPAKNLTTEYAPGVTVIVAYNVDTQEDDVIGVDTILTPLEHGSAAAGLNSGRKVASIPTPVTARDIVTGGLFPDSANGGLYVRVASFWHAGGKWQDEPFLIAPTATSGKKSLVCVGIDPATNASYTALTTDRALSATLIMNGEISGLVTDTDSPAADVWTVLSADPQIIWVGAVELAYGATSINPNKVMDLRLWMYPSYTGATVSADGVPGLVPPAASADKDKFLKGDGTFDTPASSSATPAFGAGVTKTLSSDVASAGSDRHLIIAAQSGTADNLIEITGLSTGDEVIIRADAGDTITVKHNDAGATWAAETSLPTRYDNNLPNNAGTWKPGLWMHPGGNGQAFVSVARATANPPGADLYETSDYGATWAQVGTLDMGDWTSGCIVKPVSRSDVIFHGYTDYTPAVVDRVKRFIGSTPADITPTISGSTYGVAHGGYNQRALSSADDDAAALVMIGYNVANTKFCVLQTFNALATPPTWNVLIPPDTTVPYRGAYYVNHTLIYLIGEGGTLARLTYSSGSWSIVTATAAGAGGIRGLFGK